MTRVTLHFPRYVDPDAPPEIPRYVPLAFVTDGKVHIDTVDAGCLTSREGTYFLSPKPGSRHIAVELDWWPDEEG